MYEVKRIGVISVAKITTVISFVFAAIFGLPLLALEAVIPGSGVGSYFSMLLFGAIFGFLNGCIGPLLYNALAGLVGGIELDIDINQGDPSSPGPPPE
jgi:hypothetical protein